MAYLLNAFYLLAIVLASPWLFWNGWRKGKYRAGFGEKFFGSVPTRAGNRPCVWLHAVSVGEVNLLAPVLKELARRHPDWECVISATTRAGMELARKKYAQHTVFNCPLDFSWAVRRAMRRLRPDLLVLAELELWPNLIGASRERGARVAVINGRLSARSFRGYRRMRFFARRMLGQIDLIAAQNKEYADRFLALGADVEKVHITGSIKYDGAQTDRRNAGTLRLAKLAGMGESDVVWLAGSTQAPEEEIVLQAYQSLTRSIPRLRLILVPRHPERFAEVAELLARSGISFVRRSELESRGASEAVPRVLLVDVVGELGLWWGTADVAFVGGSLGNRGGQNMIEPAAYGAAVCFGPNTRNFRDIVEQLLAAKAAVVVQDGVELESFVRRAIEEPFYAGELGARAKAFVAGQMGATARTEALLAELLPSADVSAVARPAA